MKHWKNIKFYDVIWRERTRFSRASKKRTSLKPQEIGKGVKEW